MVSVTFPWPDLVIVASSYSTFAASCGPVHMHLFWHSPFHWAFLFSLSLVLGGRVLGRYLVLWWRQLVLQQFLVVRFTVEVNKGGLSLRSGRGSAQSQTLKWGFTPQEKTQR